MRFIIPVLGEEFFKNITNLIHDASCLQISNQNLRLLYIPEN